MDYKSKVTSSKVLTDILTRVLSEPPAMLVMHITSSVPPQLKMLIKKEDVVQYLKKLEIKASFDDDGEQVSPICIDVQKISLPKRIISNQPSIVRPSHLDQFTYTKPIKVVIGDNAGDVKNWKETLIYVCNVVAEQNIDEFSSVIQNIKGEERPYFSKVKTTLRDPHLVNGTSIYVETNLSANNIKVLCDSLSNYFGYGKEVEIKLNKQLK